MPYPDLIDGTAYDEAAAGTGDLYRLAAQNAIRRYCGWHISPSTLETIVIDGSGRTVQVLPSLYVEDITTVTENGTTLDVTTLEWSADGIMRRVGQPWTSRMRGLTVTLIHGFEDVPELQAFVVSIAERAKASPAGVVQEAAGAVSIRFSTFGSGSAGGVALMEHEYALLNRYRLPGRL